MPTEKKPDLYVGGQKNKTDKNESLLRCRCIIYSTYIIKILYIGTHVGIYTRARLLQWHTLQGVNTSKTSYLS